MATVGIIANPASGKDIRRLVAHGSVFTNQEKVNIVRRVLLGLQATGVEEAIFMPDYFGIGARAVDGVRLALKTSTLQMPLRGTQEDSTEAAARFRELQVGCIITLGGDGTNHAVAKGCGKIPLLPISTGTNNVFPCMVEGSIAGLAAGVITSQIVRLDRVFQQTKRLEIERNDQMIDIALIDVVVYDDVFLASRAVWNMSKVREIVLARADPSNIGLSSIGGCLYPGSLDEKHGIHIKIGQGDQRVLAAIAPGLIKRIDIESHGLIKLNEAVEVNHKPSVLALDGEREVETGKKDRISIRLTNNGPYVVDIKGALKEAAQKGFFINRDT
ncbi:MAG: NAD(+)/NADH kinase [Thermodesulfobacteriota bacterium]|jgi:predicted polyphosphate/ATP-dependent NAD kinase